MDFGNEFDDNIGVSDPNVTDMVYQQPEVESIYANDDTASLYNQQYMQNNMNDLGMPEMPLQNDINEYGSDMDSQPMADDNEDDEIANQVYNLKKLEKQLSRKIRSVKKRRLSKKKKSHRVRRLINKNLLIGAGVVGGSLALGKGATVFMQARKIREQNQLLNQAQMNYNQNKAFLENSIRETTSKLNNLALKVDELAETSTSMLGDLDIWTAGHILNHHRKRH